MLKRPGIIMVLILILVITGCASNAVVTTSPTSTAAISATDPVTTTVVAPVSLKIGSLPRIFDLVLYTAQQESVFTNNHLQVEIVPFRSVVERNNAFLAGQLDGFVDSIYEAINLNKDSINCKVVGHNLMPDMFKIVVAPSSGITSPSQLAGKDIATSTSTIMEFALDTLLASEGVTGKANYLNVPNMPLRLEMMAQGKVPAAILTPPLSEQAIANGNTLILDDSKKLLAGPSLIFSNNVLNTKSEGVSNFIQSWQQTVKMINANPDKYRSLLVSTAQVPEALAGSYKVPVFPEVRLPSQAELSTLVDWMKSRGMLTKDIPYENVVETKYLK